mmetsp:Transcript_38736/g.81455  ORF Transcript_38736/g.81455 Transcript_38736/m.81455 type:complete len:88 (+) Transcript_38736:335-598(+)|eukprot:CAMPEP_0183703130 /NCGR_PEP_ID=MMETSP0737-20130205/991_1 /TAXON_ID=385413 /ORGANISM="Thalassiosira miniscula, Strain CCMP1093" /LENGTH=87 /DNA_ID=CAMNT_0025929839 /DNA_START=198 /DNA_END=461 /DNA_ORIENTATION=+
MIFRQLLSSVVFPNLEKDLSRTIGREFVKMECDFAPQVYGFRPKVPPVGGAFASTVPMRQQTPQQNNMVLKRVDIPFKANQGMFHEF